MINRNMPIRIQFTLYSGVQAEVIVQGFDEAERTIHKFFQLKHKRGLAYGGCISQDASRPRLIDYKEDK